MAKSSLMQGSFYLLLAQVVFVATGYLIQIGLGRMLGPAMYGVYGVIIALITLINIIFITGIQQSISKFAAENKNKAEIIKHKSVMIQLLLGLLVSAIYFLAAPYIAFLLNDASLTPLIQLSALIIPGYAVYSVFIGFMNGTREYGKQAKATIVYNIAKVSFIFLLVLIGFSVSGAIIGFAMAPILGLIAGLVLAGWKKTGEKFSAKKLLWFSIPVIVFSVAINFTLDIALLSVKSLLTASEQAGYYNAAYQISKMLMFFSGALAGVLFPAISHASYNKLAEKTKQHILEATRYALIFLVPSAFLLSALSKQVISLLYGKEYVFGASALSVLVFATLFFSFYSLFASVIVASGKPKRTMLLGITILLIAFGLNQLLIPAYGLVGAGFATLIACFIGFAVSAAYVLRLFKALFSRKTLLKTITASLVVFVIAGFVKFSGVLLVVELAALFGLYLVILIVLKELDAEDFAELKSVLLFRGQK